GHRHDRQLSVIRLLNVRGVERNDRSIGLYDHAVGADYAEQICPVEFSDPITDTDDRGREGRQQEIGGLPTLEHVGPWPFAECACQTSIEKKRLPLLFV